MVKTIDGKNDLWPRSQSGSVDCFAPQVFYLAGTAPKIQSGILKLGYGAPLKNLDVLETAGQQPCVALSEVQERLLRQMGEHAEHGSPTWPASRMCLLCLAPMGTWVWDPRMMLLRSHIRALQGKQMCVWGGGGQGGSAFYRHRKQSFILMLLDK